MYGLKYNIMNLWVYKQEVGKFEKKVAITIVECAMN